MSNSRRHLAVAVAAMVLAAFWLILQHTHASAQEYGGRGFRLDSAANCTAPSIPAGWYYGELPPVSNPVVNPSNPACPEQLLIGVSASFEVVYFRVTQENPNLSVFIGTKRASTGGFYQITGFNYNAATARLDSPYGHATVHRLQFFAWQAGKGGLRWRNPQRGGTLTLQTHVNGDVHFPAHRSMSRLYWYGYYHGACLVQNGCPDNHSFEDLDPWWQGKVVWMPAYGGNPDPLYEPAASENIYGDYWNDGWNDKNPRIYYTALEDYENDPIHEIWGGVSSTSADASNGMVARFFKLRRYVVDSRLPLRECYMRGLPGKKYIKGGTDCTLLGYTDGDPWSNTTGLSWASDPAHTAPWQPQMLREAPRLHVFDELASRQICCPVGGPNCVTRPGDLVPMEADFFACSGAVLESSVFAGSTPCAYEDCPAETVTIDVIRPAKSVICDDCEVEFRTNACRTVQWEVTEGQSFVQPPHSALGPVFAIEMISRTLRGDDPRFGKVVVRLSDVFHPDTVFDEYALYSWRPPDNVNQIRVRIPMPGIEDIEFVGSPEEYAFGVRHLLCYREVYDIRNEGEREAERHFDQVMCYPPGDNNSWNAFVHAFGSCEMVRRCNLAQAEQLGNAHEEYTRDAGGGLQRCALASIDLHNNAVGRRLADKNPNDDCADLIVDAINNGQCIWADPADPPVPDCATYSSQPEAPCIPQ